ncbi:MAG: GGDEF domain-containing protein [Gammaproteobacteria bacterium]|nr:GGDEF domain-containing protein [Gammaproteobacteria bacterium]
MMQYINTGHSLNTEIQLETLRSNIQGLAKVKGRSKTRQEEVEHAALRLSQQLQRTLDIQALQQFFCQEIATLVPCDSTSYKNKEQSLGYSYGTKGKHICQYKLELEDQYLGDLICTRNKPFGDQDLLIIEGLAGSLVYPLRNALMYQQAINMALQDPLTGVGNRKALENAVTREQHLLERNETPFSMLMIDIDFFKKINDEFGHSAGDKILQAVSQIIMDIIRQSDELFRFGGEEFVVLLNNTEVNSATFVAERIRQAIETFETECANQSIKVTISIGVANFEKNERMDQLFNRADQALYKAKDNGRNQICVAS